MLLMLLTLSPLAFSGGEMYNSSDQYNPMDHSNGLVSVGGPGTAAPKSPKPFGFRASTSVGPRYVNDEVMNGDAWDTNLRLSFAAYTGCKTYDCLYGLEMGGNTSWSARFNSVNNPTSTSVSPVGVHNSSSLDFLAFFGFRAGRYAGIEIGVGPQISWVKWQNSVQQATSRVRVAPKLRIAISHKISEKIEIFIAASEAFNVYGSMRCSNTPFNCFNDRGYVYVTDFMVGMNYYIQSKDTYWH